MMLVFIIYSLIWMACDAIFLRPVCLLFNKLGWFKSSETREGMAEVTIAGILGAIGGLTVGEFLAVPFSKNPWSWLSAFVLIGISSIFNKFPHV